MRKAINIVFVGIFLLIITLPYLFAHREKEERISEMENRMLAKYPSIQKGDGSLNTDYTAQFENWLQDNLRGRTVITKLNAELQYELFGHVVKSDVLEGQNGWLFQRDDSILEFQNSIALSEEELNGYAQKMREISDDLNERGIAFYYVQCYFKESVYPQEYNANIRKVHEASRTERLLGKLQDIGVPVIDSMSVMEQGKETADIYYKYADLAHWNDEGAYLGYQQLMSRLQEDFPDIQILKKENYQIVPKEEKAYFYGYEYPYIDYYEAYMLKEPCAVDITEDKLSNIEWLKYREHTHWYQNPVSKSDKRILILGDSFIRMFLKEDIAESFSETLNVDWLNVLVLDQLIEEFQPDIVVLECVDVSSISVMEELMETDWTK